ncbi:MAG: TetR/AcrR family transcriptional regulator [Coprothermobacterota bacterium]|nr:TetR/AcrR family transcriptional regulator [Coprothermobacterota bacterium]
MTPQNLKSQKAEETRIALLKEAESLFALRGYDSVSVEDICEKAEVSKGGFYYHFSSKEALFLELLDRWLSRLDEELKKIESSASSVEEAVHRMTDLAGSMIEQVEGNYGILFEFWSKARQEEKIWQGAVSYFDRYKNFFIGILRKGLERGEFQLSEADLELYSRTFVSLAVGVFLQAALDPKKWDWKGTLKRMIDLLMRELKRAQA